MRTRRAGCGALLLSLAASVALARPESSAWIPFEPNASTNRVVVDLAPEGAPHRLPFTLDTGASYSFMEAGAARRLGIPVRAGKHTPYRRATRLGRDVSFLVETSSSDTGSSEEPTGYLGGNFLRRYVVGLDFAARRVAFLPPEGAQPDPKAVAVPLSIVADRPHLEIHVDGSPLRVLLDTGDPFSLSVLRSFARERGLASKRVAGLAVRGVLGPLRVELAEVASLRIGPYELERVPVLVHEGSYNQGDASGAAIGIDLLALFDVRVDYPARRLWLRQRKAEPTWFGADYRRVRASGAFLETVPEEQGAIYVRWVLPESPAARLDVRPGDWVTPPVLEEESLDLEGVHARIESGGPLEVLRKEEHGWREVKLGGGELSP